MIYRLKKLKLRLRPRPNTPPPHPPPPHSMQCYATVWATCRKQQISHLWMEGWGDGCGREGKFRKYIRYGCKSLLGNFKQRSVWKKKAEGNISLHCHCNWTLCALSGHKADPKKHVLIMDEVDGMAGNEDRGGMQVGMIVNCRLQNGAPICS